MNRGGEAASQIETTHLLTGRRFHVTAKFGLTASRPGREHGDVIEEGDSSLPHSSFMVDRAHEVCFAEFIKLT